MNGAPDHNNFSFFNEIQRKFFHLLIIIFPVLYVYLGRKYFLYFLFPIAMMVIAIDFYRHQNQKLNDLFKKIFGKIIRAHELEKGKLTGLSNALISACIIFSICPHAIAVSAFLILAISDALAAIVGKAIASRKFYEKTLAGSAAFFISAIIIFISSGLHFGQGATYYIFGFFGVFTATMIEARPSFLDFDDNLSIPLSFSIVTYGFYLVWSYH